MRTHGTLRNARSTWSEMEGKSDCGLTLRIPWLEAGWRMRHEHAMKIPSRAERRLSLAHSLPSSKKTNTAKRVEARWKCWAYHVTSWRGETPQNYAENLTQGLSSSRAPEKINERILICLRLGRLSSFLHQLSDTNKKSFPCEKREENFLFRCFRALRKLSADGGLFIKSRLSRHYFSQQWHSSERENWRRTVIATLPSLCLHQLWQCNFSLPLSSLILCVPFSPSSSGWKTLHCNKFAFCLKRESEREREVNFFQFMHHVEKVQPYNQTQECLPRSSSVLPGRNSGLLKFFVKEKRGKGLRDSSSWGLLGEEELRDAQLHYYETLRA